MRYMIIALCLTLLGCGVGVRKAPATPESDSQMVYVEKSKYPRPWSNEGIYVPNWLTNPSMGGKYEAAVGSVLDTKMSDHEKTELAVKRAVAEISRSRKVHIKSSQRQYSAETKSDVTQYMDETISADSQETVANSKLVETWIHPKTGEFYVWVVVY